MTDSEIENIQQMQQEIERLRNENTHLRRELYPPRSEQRELRYWIVTWLDNANNAQAIAVNMWAGALQIKDDTIKAGFTHIRILEQIVFV